MCLSHGGPTGALYRRLTGNAAPLVRFTGLFIYVKDDATTGDAATGDATTGDATTGDATAGDEAGEKREAGESAVPLPHSPKG